MLGEAPSTAMLTDLVTKANAGSTVQELADSLATNAAFTGQFPIWMTATEFTSKIVTNMFAGSSVSQADSDAAVDYIAGMITAGTFTKTSAVVALTSYLASADGVANATYGTAAQSYQNKVEVAEYYTITSGQGGASAADRKAAISGVGATTDVATTTATIKAEGEAAAIEAAKVPSKVLTLTNAAETLTGGAGDDTIVGVVAAAGGTTATSILPGDVINAGAGVDTLSINISGDPGAGVDYAITAIQASGLEKISFNAFDTRDDQVHSMDLTLMGSDVTDVELASSNANGDVTITGSKSILDAAMKNGGGDLTLTYGAATVIGAADTQKLHLANATAGTFSAAGIETIDITTSLAKSKLTALTASGMTNLNITGDQKLTITGGVDFKDNASGTATDGTIDASGTTAGVDLTFGAADNNAVTGGTGDDVFRFGTTKNVYDAIDGGGGDDTVAVSLSAGSGAGAAYLGALSGLTSVENLDVTTTNNATAVDMKSMSTDVTNVAISSGTARVYTVTGTIDTPGEDLAFTLNGVTRAIATAVGTNTAAEMGAEITTAINALTGFSAVAGGGGASEISITNTTGRVIEFSSLVNTTDATDLIAFTVGDLTDAAVSNLLDDGSQTVSVHSVDDLTLSLVDGSGSDDKISLALVTDAGNKGFKKTIDSVVIAAVETLSVDVSGMTDKIDTVITTLTADAKLTTLTVTGDSDLDMTGTVTASKLATIDASAFTGDLLIDVPGLTGGSTITGGAGADNFQFQGAVGLNALDVVVGGDGSDKLSASIAGATGSLEALGALNVTGVERLNLAHAGANASLNALGIVGATEIALNGAGAITTVTNLAAGVNFGFGTYSTDSATSGRVDLALADATGTEDALTIKLNDRAGGNTNAIDVRAADIETVTFTVAGYSTDNALANHALTVNKLNAATINVTGATYDAGNTLSLGTLDSDTTTVDGSTFNGRLTATAATGVGTAMSAKGGRVHTLTGSTGSDTFTLVGSVTNDDSTIAGGGGTDTLNLTLGTGVATLNGVTNVDTINIAVAGGAVITTNAAATDLDGINESTSTVVTGGNSLSTFTLGGNTDQIDGGSATNVIDFSGYGGRAVVYYAANGFDDLELGYTQQVIGGSSLLDTVVASYDADTDESVAINMQGVEVLQITALNSNTELVADMTKTTGIGQVNVIDTSNESIELANLAAGAKVHAETTDTTNTIVEVKLASTAGATDALSLGAVAAGADDNLKFVVADVETVTIASLGALLSNPASASTAEVDLDLSGISMTAAGATTDVVLTGSVALEITATNADIASIDASARSGAVTQTGRSKLTGSTYTGGSGADRFIMNSSGDTMDGGLGTDTLDINVAAVLGGINIDLSSTTNQITAMNGGAITGTILGFESVDLAGYGTFGAVVQAGKTGGTIVGTATNDQITGGAGADLITMTAGAAEQLNLGGGNDVVTISATLIEAMDNNTVQINAGSGTADAITMSNATTGLIDADLARVTGVEVLNLFNGTNTVVVGANANTSGIATINGGTGADTVTLGPGNQTFLGGLGADNVTILGASNAYDVVNLTEASGTGVDTVIFDTTLSATHSTIINGFSSAGTDVIKIDGDDVGIALTNGVSAPAYTEAVATAADAANSGGANDTVKVLTNNLSAAAGTAITAFQAAPTDANQTAMIAAIVGSTAAGQPFAAGLHSSMRDATDKVVLSVDDGTNSVVFLYTSGGGTGTANATLEAAEVSIIAVVDGAVGLANLADV
jgi:hypothetical protein